MKQIPLSQDKVALVDDEDFEWLNRWKWYFEGRYAIHKVNLGNNTWKTFWMHREIMHAPEGIEVDHVNADGLDDRCNNQKYNLRLATRAQNQHNRDKYARNKTGFKGVFCRPENGKFRAIIALEGKNQYLGQFPTAQQAATAYDAAAKQLHGNFARTNQ